MAGDECKTDWTVWCSPCQKESAFDARLNAVVGRFEYRVPCRFEDVTCTLTRPRTQLEIAEISLKTVITTHSDICFPSYIANGKCPRAMVSALGDLYREDLCFSMGAGPLFTFLRATPAARRATQWLVRTVFRKADYEARTSVDRLIMGTVFLVELPLVLGFCYPVLPLLACLTMALNAGVFRVVVMHLDVELTNNAPVRISMNYLSLIHI